MARSSGKFVRHIPCTSPDHESTDSMALYRQADGSYDGTCMNPTCGYFDPDPLAHTNLKPNDGLKSEVKSTIKIGQVLECPLLPIPSREIKQQAVDFYEVRTLLNGLDGKTPVALGFPYYVYNTTSNTNTLSGYKKRTIEDKIFTSIGNTKDTLLFGQQKFLAGGKKLYITEGEIDALSLWQVLKDGAGPQWKHLNPCVVSLPHGAASAVTALSNNRDFLDNFQEIILVFDQDEAGREAVQKVCAFLDPSKVKIATFSEKDPNDMIKAGKASELRWSVLSLAKPYQPEGITTSSKLLREALRPSQRGSEWPWPTLTKITYGRHPGLYGFGAGVGIGKTEAFHELIHFIAQEEQKPVGVFLLEEAPQRTLKILAGKCLNTPLHRPDIQYNQEDVESAITSFFEPREKLYFFDHKGSRDWDTIYSQCKYLAAVHGVRDLIIDPLTAITSHQENTNRFLHKMMAEMAVLAQEPYNCSVYFSSHLNEPPRDRIPHEEGGRVKEAHFADSRAMIRFSNYIFGLERNKQDPDVVQRNTTTFRVLKDRDFGSATGETFEIYYDTGTGRYQEVNDIF